MELMVVLAVVVIAAALARVGVRRNERAGQHRRFVADVHGAVVRAHDIAIDEQRPVRIDLGATSLVLSARNPQTDVWERRGQVTLGSQRTGLLVGDGVCIEGLRAGVRAPSSAGVLDVPTDCLGNPQRMRFEPDGTFVVSGVATLVDNAGVNLWIVDRSVADAPVHAVVQIFPGGLIQVLEGIG
ncbi:MAG: hypothetical protein AAGF11_25275 [Myxococcota bacterium]